MNKQEIIELAKQGNNGKVRDPMNTHMFFVDELIFFANLIESAVIKRLSAVAGEPWCASYDTVEARGGAFLFYTEEQVAAAVAAEREACAEVCYDVAHGYYLQHNPQMEQVADECADAIRGRT